MASRTDFIPAREADLVTFGNQYARLVVAGYAGYGLTQAQSAAVATTMDAFVGAYNACQGNDTRTPSQLIAKDKAKAAAVAEIRLTARIIQANPVVTDQQKSDLGLTVRTGGRTPLPVPATAPMLDIVSATNTSLQIRLHAGLAGTTRRGKPKGVAGASIWSAIAPAAPAAIADWKFEGNVTRTDATITFDPATPPGTKVWLCACWYNPKAATGAACNPVGANLPGGGAVPMGGTATKIAA